MLAPLATMAEQRRTSVLAACTSPRPRWTRCWGRWRRVGFIGAARSVLIFGVDPTDEQGNRGPARVLAHRKCNVGPIAGR